MTIFFIFTIISIDFIIDNTLITIEIRDKIISVINI